MIRFGEVEKNDMEEIIRIYEEYLNSGDYIRQDIIKNFGTDGYFGYKACCDGKIVGVISARQGMSLTYPHADIEEEIYSYTKGHKVYTPDMLVVLPQYRRQKIAGRLVSKMRERLLLTGQELALTELWIYPDGSIPAKTAIGTLGKVIFEKKIPDFYKENGKYNISCPVCGKNCKCGALIQIFQFGDAG